MSPVEEEEAGLAEDEAGLALTGFLVGNSPAPTYSRAQSSSAARRKAKSGREIKKGAGGKLARAIK